MSIPYPLLLRLNDDAAQVAFAITLRHDLGIATQGKMDDPAFVGRHRLQRNRPATARDLPGDPFSQPNQ